MQTILIFSLAFDIIATIGTAYFSWKIMRLNVTPSGTWSLKFLACIVQIVSLVWGVAFVHDITEFAATYPPEQLVISYALTALRMGLLFAFVSRVYFSLKERFPLL